MIEHVLPSGEVCLGNYFVMRWIDIGATEEYALEKLSTIFR